MRDSSAFVVKELCSAGLITPEESARVSEEARAAGESVCETLTRLGLVTDREVAISRAKICEYPFVDLAAFDISIDNARLLPRATAERLCAFPLFEAGGIATVAMADPLNIRAIDEVRQIMRTEIEPVVCDTQRLKSLMARAYSILGTAEETESDSAHAADVDLANESDPIVSAVNQILAAGLERNASDIHLCPDERALHLRYRIDGALQVEQGPGLAVHSAMVQRLKVLAKLDLTQTRIPQDGKFRFYSGGKGIDVRMSVAPTIHGENVVLRLLRPAGEIGDISTLEMPQDLEDWFGEIIRRPHGMLLNTGPTGSGKTTTLYTGLAALNTPERNIMTIEDPVEIRLPLIRQIQVNTDIGLTFARALRSILRQDPDIIMVGEIRDEETAKIAVQAAMTGHLVFSTLHTNDAVASVNRLRDFGTPPFAINAALLGCFAQRLVLRNCASCVSPSTPDPTDLAAIGLEPSDGYGFSAGHGCDDCAGVGFKGRIAVYEAMRIDAPLRGLIEGGAPYGELFASARKSGMRTILDDGLEKARRGLTTVSELRRLVATSGVAAMKNSEGPDEPTGVAA